ncbi:MAG: hypothetical protein AAGE37_03395 [Pseudomonadota bacterium]
MSVCGKSRLFDLLQRAINRNRQKGKDLMDGGLFRAENATIYYKEVIVPEDHMGHPLTLPSYPEF